MTATATWATFFVGSEMLGVGVDQVQELLIDQSLTPVPLAPSAVAGLLNLRGQVLPVLDLRVRLGLEAGGQTRRSLVVLRSGAAPLALAVDAIGDVLELSAERWRPLPETVAVHDRELIFGVCPLEGRVLLGLGAEALGLAMDAQNAADEEKQ